MADPAALNLTPGETDRITLFHGGFYLYLRTKNGGAERDIEVDRFSHPGFNNLYGIEIEFMASRPRTVIGNRVNTCMFNQNDEWWRRNFDALAGPIAPALPSGPKSLTNGLSFDEYSSFFLEVSHDHGGTCHRGDAILANKGNAGQRIENDSSVELDNNGPGITLWSLKANNRFKNTDFRDNGPAWGPNARGLRDTWCRTNYRQIDNTSAQFTLGVDGFNRPHTWNIPGNDETKFRVVNEHEYVSSVLVNTPVVYRERRYPLGSLLVDNLITHMKSHDIVLAVQRCGFHVHLSEVPRLLQPADPHIIGFDRRSMIIGFVKLFYVFEPLLYSFHPYYRSESNWCQSIQSIFNFNEIYSSNVIQLWNDLVVGTHIGGANRKIRSSAGDIEHGLRYLALNLRNCVDGGIGTIEVRLGHSSFSSSFVQSYINFLQNLFTLNLSLMHVDNANGHAVLNSHNNILNIANIKGIIPYYCHQSPAEYNRQPHNLFGPIDNAPGWGANRGSPVKGFFLSHNNQTVKTNILRKSIELFTRLTGAYDLMNNLIPYINYYHTTNDDWLCRTSINPIPLLLAGAGAWWNQFIPVQMGRDYDVAVGKSDTLDRCNTCSYNRTSPQQPGPCGVDFGGGVELGRAPGTIIDVIPPAQRNHSDETHYYRYWYRVPRPGLPDLMRSHTNKAQTELIDYKTGQGGILHPMRGGGRSNKQTRQTIKLRRKRGGGVVNTIMSTIFSSGKNQKNSAQNTRSQTRKKNNTQVEESSASNSLSSNVKVVKLSPEEEYVKYYKVNAGAANIIMTDNTQGPVTLGYADWMGGFTPDKKLSAIANACLDKHIISRELLHTLVYNKYIDMYVYLDETALHKNALNRELATLNIQPETIDAIRQVYKEFAPIKMDEKIVNPFNSIKNKAKKNANK